MTFMLAKHATQFMNSLNIANGVIKHKNIISQSLINYQRRNISSYGVTNNIKYISKNKNLNFEKDPKTLKLMNPLNKPLCIILNWLTAKEKHIQKYANIYLDRGFDVLSIRCTPWQILWPPKGSQLVAAELLQFLHINETFNPMVIHGFSMGGYLWGETMFIGSSNKTKYQPTFDRIIAQTWDSLADITELPVGFPKALFPNNKIIENTLRKYIIYHMKTFHESATIHYMRSSQQFHRTLCKAPALLFLSKSDPAGAESSNQQLRDSWISLGIKTSWKCWDKSPHVQHFNKHREEYLITLNEHLNSVGLISQLDKLEMRL